MRKLFATISTLFFSLVYYGVAFAGSAATNANQQIQSLYTPKTDLSIAYLSQIFGTVGGVLHGTSGQMLGMLFYRFNQGILVVAGFWLAYTTLTIVLKSAQEGSFMGPNKNVALAFLKIALGLGLLLPNPSTGYSIFQDVVMKVAVEGVALADQTWSYGLNYISEGGTLWRRPESGAVSGLDKLAKSPKAGLWVSAQKIYADEVCMVASSALNQNNTNNTSESSLNSIVNSNPPPAQYTIREDTKNHRFIFPGYGNTDQDKYPDNCGAVNWLSISYADKNENKVFAKAATRELVYGLLPAAKRTVCTMNAFSDTSICQGISNTDAANDSTNAFMNGAANFLSSILPVAQREARKAARMAEDFIPNAQKSGWMTAGRYYWDLSRIQAHYGKVTNLLSYYPSGILVPVVTNSQVKNAISTAKKLAAPNSKGTGYVDHAMAKMRQYAKANSKGDTGGDHTVASSAWKKAAVAGGGLLVGSPVALLLGPFISDLTNLIMTFSTSTGAFGMGADPILFLHNVGMGCLALAGDIWFEMALIIGGLLALTVVCQSTLNLSTPIEGVSSWIKTPLMVLAALLFGVGILLGFYVPLYPYILFTFGVIGWIIAVLEAMVAAPLVCLGLTHPENHDFLGASQQALMLLLGVFIQPVLMIIGLIAGMILSYVSLRIVIYTFAGFIRDLFYLTAPTPGSNSNILHSASLAMANTMGSSGSVGGAFISLMVFPLMLVFFAGIVYFVVIYTYSPVTALRANILNWIGGPSSQNLGEQLAGQMRSVASTAGSQGGDLTNRAMDYGADRQTKEAKKLSDKMQKKQKRTIDLNK